MTTTAGHRFYIGPIVFFYYWNEMEKLYRGPYIDAYCQVWFHLAKLFQRRKLNQRLSRDCIKQLGQMEPNLA
jgi:hypothetical protein